MQVSQMRAYINNTAQIHILPRQFIYYECNLYIIKAFYILPVQLIYYQGILYITRAIFWF